MKRGYSIMEVLVAVAILSIALPGLVRWVTASRQTQLGSFRSEQATEIAQTVMDSLRDVPRAIRTKATNTTLVKNGTTYTMSWDYLDDSAKAYRSPRPGAAWVELQWNVGNASRVSRLNGVLP
jgi:prepilin-type N-terminal cleavage/methylation domain-containing protein